MATVMPYTNNATVTSPMKSPASPVLPRKPPLTLQESGIFEEEEEAEEEEEHEDDEGAEMELASRGTQTEVPSGELLQEVQRLQELRARIQERAAKITTPPVIFHTNDPSSKICGLDVDSMVQLAACQERVRELEVRLEMYEGTEKSREREKRLSKQREEELLDENYRLTEKMHWLENELRIVRGSSSLDEIDEGESGTTIVQRAADSTERNEHEVSGNPLASSSDAQDPPGITSPDDDTVPTVQACTNNVTERPRPSGQTAGVANLEPGMRRNVTVRK